jgi:hypothetical protein
MPFVVGTNCKSALSLLTYPSHQVFNINQCLFGLHLINESNQKTIAVVESEKTAVLISVFKPQYTLGLQQE